MKVEGRHVSKNQRPTVSINEAYALSPQYQFIVGIGGLT